MPDSLTVCAICHAPVVPGEAARLGLDRGRVAWEARGATPFNTRRFLLALAVVATGMIGRTIADALAPRWVGLIPLAAAGVALVVFFRKDFRSDS